MQRDLVSIFLYFFVLGSILSNMYPCITKCSHCHWHLKPFRENDHNSHWHLKPFVHVFEVSYGRLSKHPIIIYLLKITVKLVFPLKIIASNCSIILSSFVLAYNSHDCKERVNRQIQDQESNDFIDSIYECLIFMLPR